MFWRRETLRSGETVSAGVPYKLQLPRAGLLGSLLIKIDATDEGTLGLNGGNWRITDFISKIEVSVEGSKVVKSLTGYQVDALAFWDQGVMGPNRWRNYATNTQQQWYLVNFGRWMKDMDLGLDLAMYNSTELNIENTFTASYLTGVTVTVEGLFLNDAGANQFAGVLRTEEWRSWTTVQNQWVYNELPVEYPIRRIMLQAIPSATAGVFATNMANLMYDINLKLDTGNISVFTGGLSDLMRENYLDWGKPVITGGLQYTNADKAVDYGAGYGLYRAGISGSKDGAGSATVPTITADENNGSQTTESFEADSPIEMVNIGMAPFHTALFRFDDDYNPANYLDPNARKVVKLDIHTRDSASAASGTNKIILDRLVVGRL